MEIAISGTIIEEATDTVKLPCFRKQLYALSKNKRHSVRVEVLVASESRTRLGITDVADLVKYAIREGQISLEKITRHAYCGRQAHHFPDQPEGK